MISIGRALSYMEDARRPESLVFLERLPTNHEAVDASREVVLFHLGFNIALALLFIAANLALGLFFSTLAAYAFARFEFPGRNVLFALVLVQLMVMPDVLIVENYRTMSALGLRDTILAIAKIRGN